MSPHEPLPEQGSTLQSRSNEGPSVTNPGGAVSPSQTQDSASVGAVPRSTHIYETNLSVLHRLPSLLRVQDQDIRNLQRDDEDSTTTNSVASTPTARHHHQSFASVEEASSAGDEEFPGGHGRGVSSPPSIQQMTDRITEEAFCRATEKWLDGTAKETVQKYISRADYQMDVTAKRRAYEKAKEKQAAARQERIDLRGRGERIMAKCEYEGNARVDATDYDYIKALEDLSNSMAHHFILDSSEDESDQIF